MISSKDEGLDNVPSDDGTNLEHGDSKISRRSLIVGAGAAGGAALVGSDLLASTSAAALQDATPEATPVAGGLPPEIPQWTLEWGPPPSEYGARSPFEDGVVRDPSATSSRSPLADLRGIITPNSLFFERHHAGIPQIDPSVHRLIIHGMVDRPVEFTLDDIKRFPSKSVIHFHECSGNTGSEWKEDTIRDTV
jgi:sulfane dehydrogenase subunit SoxC